MSVRTKIFYIFLVLTAIAFVGQGLVMQFVVYPQFVHLEEQGARQDMERIQQGIKAEVKNLDILCHAWSSWDDSLAFVAGRKPGFVKSSIPPEIVAAATIDYLHFIDRRGRTKYYRAIDPVTGRSLMADDLDFDATRGLDLLFQGEDVSGVDSGRLVRSGFVYVDFVPEPLLIVARPILASSGNGQIGGTLIMGRFLNIDALQQQVGVDVAFVPVKGLNRGLNREMLHLLESGEPPPLIRYADDFIYSYRLQDGLVGGVLCLVVGHKSAEIIQHGRAVQRMVMSCSVIVSVLLLLAVFFVFRRTVTSPLLFLNGKTKEIIKSGNFSATIEVGGAGEIADLGRSINGLLQRIVSHEQLLFAANNKLLEQSLTDALTGLANRRDFDAYIKKEWTRLQRSGFPMSIIMCDVDYFKKYNDAYGHQQGDTCLQSLAEALDNAVRRPPDLVARYGGEEFIIILPETDTKGALHIAHKICTEVRALKIEHIVSDVSPCVTISVGVATLIPYEQAKPEYLVRMADEALYLAKEYGRNRVEVARI